MKINCVLNYNNRVSVINCKAGTRIAKPQQIGDAIKTAAQMGALFGISKFVVDIIDNIKSQKSS